MYLWYTPTLVPVKNYKNTPSLLQFTTIVDRHFPSGLAALAP